MFYNQAIKLVNINFIIKIIEDYVCMTIQYYDSSYMANKLIPKY